MSVLLHSYLWDYRHGHYMAMVLFLKGLEESSYVIEKQSTPASRLAQSLLTSPTPAHKLPFSHSHVTLEKNPHFSSFSLGESLGSSE